MKKTIVIGIAGGSASGKTSISQQLKDRYENTQSVVMIIIKIKARRRWKSV